MASRVEEMIATSVRAVTERDPELARKTISIDRQVNADEVSTDEMCLLILAKRQPVAGDLRFVTLALKMVTDLERIGDLAVSISERAIQLATEPSIKPYDDIPKMAVVVQAMVRGAIDAFVSRDAEKAKAVIARDDEVDELYHKVFRELLAVMTKDGSLVERGIHVQSVAKYLERMGDHSTNLAEQVVFMVEAIDIRHAGKRA